MDRSPTYNAPATRYSKSASESSQALQTESTEDQPSRHNQHRLQAQVTRLTIHLHPHHVLIRWDFSYLSSSTYRLLPGTASGFLDYLAEPSRNPGQQCFVLLPYSRPHHRPYRSASRDHLIAQSVFPRQIALLTPECS